MLLSLSPRSTAPTLLLMLATGLLASADDIVVMTAKEGRGTTRTVGEVVDFNGKQLVLRRAGNREEIIEAGRVIDVKIELTEEHRTADAFFAQRDFEQALASYQRAERAEKREWVVRRVRVQMIWCHKNLGSLDRAVSLYVSLFRSDPSHQYFDAIPVVWIPAPISPGREKRAAEMLAEDQGEDVEHLRLIGASWLIPTGRRSNAVAALRILSNSKDARIGFWAIAQLWRTEVVTASPEVVERWRKTLDRMPPSLQPAPAFILGQAYSRLKKHDEAAMLFMRAPILLPQDRRLCSEALLAAAQELETMDRKTEVVTLYREAATESDKFPGTAIARERLEKLKAP